MKQRTYTLRLDAIVGGGQAIGTLDDGRKAFVWGGLPGETITMRVTKKKSKFIEGVVTDVHTTSPERIAPHDPDGYLSTSPWQIMTFAAEQHYKSALVEEAFELHDIVLPHPIEMYSDGVEYGYRNKVEFSWYGSVSAADSSEQRVVSGGRLNDAAALQQINAEQTTTSSPSLQPSDSEGSAFPAERDQDQLASSEARVPEGNDGRSGGASQEAERASGDDRREVTNGEQLDLAFFRRGSKGKIIVDGTSLAREEINVTARTIRDRLQAAGISARQLKTLLIRCNQQGNCVWQLYVKTLDFPVSGLNLDTVGQGGEVIYSDPRSPASRITKRLTRFGNIVLEDHILDVPFRYATEGFFQVNIPVYEQALRDMRGWLQPASSKQQVVSSKYVSVQTPQSTALSSPSPQPSHAEGSMLPAELTVGQVVNEVGVPEGNDGRSDGVSYKTSAMSTRVQSQPSLSVSRDAVFPAEASQDRLADSGERAPETDGDEMANSINQSTTAGTSAIHSLQGERQDSELISASQWRGKPLLDLYSGVGTIGLTIGGDACTLVEIDENAVREMRRNITELGSNAHAVLAPSEKALEHITGDHIVIVDPPRAGLHADVIARLLETKPQRIIYLSCNPVTQARDVALLAETYGIRAHRGYNFFPRTPHIEHLVILDRLP